MAAMAAVGRCRVVEKMQIAHGSFACSKESVDIIHSDRRALLTVAMVRGR